MKRKALCLFLTLCMIFTSIPLVALADANTQGEEQQNIQTLLDSTAEAAPATTDADNMEKERAEWLEYLEQNNIQIPSGTQSSSNSTVVMATPATTITNAFATRIQQNLSANVVSRYTVLVLDISGSMSGAPLNYLKIAANNFCEQVLSADGNNFVAVVTYDSYSDVACEFSDNLSDLQDSINGIWLGGSTNTTAGIKNADTLLNAIPSGVNVIKNILIMSDGMPNTGEYSYSGKYSYSDYYSYSYANAAYNAAKSLHNKGYYIYSLGFFHSLYSSELPFARRFMSDLQNAGYYEVLDPNDLEFAFGQIGGEVGTDNWYTFRYAAPTDEDFDYEANCYYTDTYFSGSAFDYNPSLSTMSLCFELAAWGSNEDGVGPEGKEGVDYTNKAKNAKKLLTDIGFENTEENDYFKQKPETDSMGVVTAYKNTVINGEAYTIIALATRGGGYEAEWAGNFDMGTSGQHAGFKEASDIAYKWLEKYVNKYKDKFEPNVKLWFAGYSRGAATVDLLAAKLNKELSIGGVDFVQEDFYAYCFEPPMGATQGDRRGSLDNNIHLIINPNDVVTKVAPPQSGFGFNHIGVDAEIIPTKTTTSYYEETSAKMRSFYESLNTKNTRETIKNNMHIVDTFQAKKLVIDLKYPITKTEIRVDDDKKPMNAFLDDLVKALAYGLKNRKTYVNELQGAVKIILSSTQGKEADDAKWSQWANVFPQKLEDHTLDLAWAYVSAELNLLPFSKSGEEALADKIDEYAIESMREVGFDTSTINGIIPTIKSAFKVLVRALLDTLVTSGVNDILSIFSNYDKIAPAHYPELCLAWMMSQDPNYGGSYQKYINGYRIVRINCPVDVNVYDSGNELVASVISNEPQDVGHTIVSSFNADGEKVLYLPADDDFKISLKATGSGVLSYSVTEFSYDTHDIAKMVNYYEVPITQGDSLTAVVPQYSQQDLDNGIGEGTKTQYALSINGNLLTPDATKTGNDAATAVHFVTVKSNDDNAGMVLGSGMRNLGAYAQVQAIANNGYVFTGWYEDGNLISTDAEYRFLVKEDITLTANFSRTNSPSVSDNASSKSNTSSQPTAYDPLANLLPKIKTAVENAAKETPIGQPVKASVQVKNATRITLEMLKQAADTAKKAGGSITLHFDTMSADGKTVVSRIYIKPEVATCDIYLSMNDTRAKNVNTLFGDYFTNKINVLSFDQQGSFGASTEIATKIDLDGMDTKNLYFYSYDKKTNKYKRIVKPDYRIDKQGYLHFATEFAGDILISDSIMQKK